MNHRMNESIVVAPAAWSHFHAAARPPRAARAPRGARACHAKKLPPQFR